MTIEPTLMQVLAFLRPRFKTAIATNRSDTLDPLLATFDLTPWFDAVVCSVDVRRPKPHPDALLKIIDTFDAAPHQMLYVGDSLVDEQAARAARVWFAAYRNPSLTAAVHLRSLFELTGILNGDADGLFVSGDATRPGRAD
jgi:phosphoglycolate phosphatase-like HAD superfamily hydrolase